MNILSLLSLSSGIAYLFLGINVLRIDLRSRAFWYFFLVCFCFSFWSVSFTWFYSAPDVKTAETAYRAASPGWLFFISFAFMFFLNLTNRSIKTWVALVFLYLPPVIFCGKMFFSSFYFDTFIRIEGVWHLVMEKSLWTAAFSVWFFSLFTVSTVYILIWKKNSTSVKEKKQAGILIVSLAVNYILSPATNLFLPFLDIRILPQLAHLVALPFIFSIYIAITRYKMLVINPQLAVDTIMSTVADFLILLDKDLRISRVNKQCLVSLGYTEEELVQRDIFSLIRPGYDRSITAGGSSEIDFLRKNGSSIPVRITWTPLFDEFGDSIGYIAAGHNIEIERFLTEARAEADQANMAKSTFLAHMSHEIRTPIASLSGIIELLSLDFRKGSAGEYLHMAKDSVKSLMTLINDLLDISKIEAGKMEFHPSVFNLQSLLETVENTFNLRAEEKRLRLTLENPLSHEKTYISDADKIKQILINLVSNAVKFTQTGAVSVSVRPSPIPPSSDSMEILEFTVEDTGAGIPEGKEPYLFTEFLQFDNAASLEYKGTGLGLAISKRLVEFLDGKIWYKKRTPQGSAFGFTIQVRKNNNPEYFSEDTVVSDISAAGLKGLKILIAEDNSSNRIFLSEHLGRYGCVIREAGNGFDCLKKHSEEQADIILMDVNMPVLNGLETARKIRAEEKAMNRLPVTIIGLTAYALKGDRERFLVGGFTDYLSKPFHIRDLLRKLSEYA